MNILIAPDSFKGSLTSIQASEVMKIDIFDVNKNFNVMVKPMADGGEDTLRVMLNALDGETISIKCTGPLGEKINTTYAIIHSNTAVIEYANIAGLIQVPIHLRNPDYTTSFGIGEVIIDGINRDCTSIILGLGGSSTNDGGLGLLLALGVKAYDKYGKEVGGYDLDVKKFKLLIFSIPIKEYQMLT